MDCQYLIGQADLFLFTAASEVLEDVVIVGVAPEGDMGAVVVGAHVVLRSSDEQVQQLVVIVATATTTGRC